MNCWWLTCSNPQSGLQKNPWLDIYREPVRMYVGPAHVPTVLPTVGSSELSTSGVFSKSLFKPLGGTTQGPVRVIPFALWSRLCALGAVCRLVGGKSAGALWISLGLFIFGITPRAALPGVRQPLCRNSLEARKVGFVQCAANERGGNDLSYFQDFRTENGSSQGQYLALIVVFIPSSFDSSPHRKGTFYEVIAESRPFFVRMVVTSRPGIRVAT